MLQKAADAVALLGLVGYVPVEHVVLATAAAVFEEQLPTGKPLRLP